MTEKTYTTNVEYDEDGTPMIVFEKDVIDSLGWLPGDTITWVKNEDGSFTLIKVEIE